MQKEPDRNPSNVSWLIFKDISIPRRRILFYLSGYNIRGNTKSILCKRGLFRVPASWSRLIFHHHRSLIRTLHLSPPFVFASYIWFIFACICFIYSNTIDSWLIFHDNGHSSGRWTFNPPFIFATKIINVQCSSIPILSKNVLISMFHFLQYKYFSPFLLN